nr:TIGR04219 family outer membrane beta-barrel protein [uncultured Sulfurimonas sp.]
MKKILTTLTCASILASSASADFARLEMGLGAWAQNASGKMSYTDNGANGQYDSDKKNITQPYLWALVKHPVPVLPNLRLEYVSLEDEGKGSGKFKDFDIGGVTTDVKYSMKQYDIIPYYNILDNTAWITLDLGLDLKIVQASIDASSKALFTGYTGSSNLVLPLVYVRGRVEIPATNIGFETDVKYLSYNTNTAYDVRAKVDYTFDAFPVVQPAIEIGYRMQKVDFEDSSSLNLDLEFSGVYAGVMFRY